MNFAAIDAARAALDKAELELAIARQTNRQNWSEATSERLQEARAIRDAALVELQEVTR